MFFTLHLHNDTNVFVVQLDIFERGVPPPVVTRNLSEDLAKRAERAKQRHTEITNQPLPTVWTVSVSYSDVVADDKRAETGEAQGREDVVDDGAVLVDGRGIQLAHGARGTAAPAAQTLEGIHPVHVALSTAGRASQAPARVVSPPAPAQIVCCIHAVPYCGLGLLGNSRRLASPRPAAGPSARRPRLRWRV